MQSVFIFSLWKQCLEISQFRISAYFHPFAKCLVGLFTLETLTFRPWVIQFSSSDFLIYFSLLFPLELLLFRCPSSLDNYTPPLPVFSLFYFFFFLEKSIFQCLSSNCHLYPVVHEWSFFVVFVYFFFNVISTPMWSSNLLPWDQGSHAPWTESARHPHEWSF